MAGNLPVKTFRLKSHKVYGVWIGTVVSLCLSILCFTARQHATLGTGLYLFSVLCFLFLCAFVFFVIGAIHMYRENYIGFFISSDGFNDISTGHNYGVVFWRDVKGIQVMDDVQNMKYKYIIVQVKNPQMYIDRESLQHKKRSLMLKLHYYGSPICFSNRGLNCNFDELLEAINKYFSNWQESVKIQ